MDEIKQFDDLPEIKKQVTKFADRLYHRSNQVWYNQLLADDTEFKGSKGKIKLHPPINVASTPTTPDGPTVRGIGRKCTFTTSIPGCYESVFYQWKFTPENGLPWYKIRKYVANASETHTINQRFWSNGTYEVRVRAQTKFWNPNTWSNWSQPHNITISNSAFVNLPNQVVVNQDMPFNCYAVGLNSSVNWEIEYGDSQSDQTRGATGQTITYIHNYSQTGNKTVNLTADDGSTYLNYNTTIEVVELIADFNLSSLGVQPNGTIYFTDATISNPALDNWTWDFGDGSPENESQNTSHQYTSPGTYNGTLSVYAQGYFSEKTRTLTVEAWKPHIISTCYEPAMIGYNDHMLIFSDFYDNASNIKEAWVNITFPDFSYKNYSLVSANTSVYGYQCYFNDTNQTGVYYYSIWTMDHSNNTNYTSGFSFEILDAFGNTIPGNQTQDVHDRITGSNYTINTNGRADSISIYINTSNVTSNVTCMIYQGNDHIVTTEEKTVTIDEAQWIIFNFSGTKPNLTADTSYILCCWSNNTCLLYYNTSVQTPGKYEAETYGTPPDPASWTSENKNYSIYCSYTTFPVISDVSATPDLVGFGNKVAIQANVTDTSSIEIVFVNISYPDNQNGNFSLRHVSDNLYSYNFSDTWIAGQYNYTIWAADEKGIINSSGGHSFNLTVNATIHVCTLKDSYGNNETINLTDPPPTGPPEIGYSLNTTGNTLHIWNTYDNYYFNTSSGIQLTNHKDDYWSHNVLMLGYYNNDQWNLMYRTDELTGFSKKIDSDDETYVNATLWKDLSYQGYDFRLAIRYHLSINDTDLTIIPYIKNLDEDDIPYKLGFGWEIKDIQIAMTEEDDWIDINQTSYPLRPTDNSSLNQTYTNLDNAIIYIKDYTSNNTIEDLYLTWDNNLTYKVKVKSRENQYNAPVILYIRIGSLNSGQEKQTEMHWHDGLGSETTQTYYFNAYMKLITWSTYPNYMVDGNENTAATTSTNNDIEDCNSNTGDGSDLGVIEKVELRALGKYATRQTDIILTPEFGGTSDGDDHTFQTTSTKAWSGYFDITSDTNAPSTWDWDDVDDLDCEVKAVPSGEGSFTAYCYKVEVRVTYEEYAAPTITNPNPVNGSSGIETTPELNVTVDDGDDDMLTAYWYSNSSGSWALFAINSSINTGSGAVSITQINTNFSAILTTYYWSVNVTDGMDWTNKTYHFTTIKPDTNVNPITPYLQISSPINITANGSSSLDNVTLWYRYSTDNSSWTGGGWWNNNWSYYKTCDISNKRDDYQMKIVIGNNTGSDVDCEGQTQLDFDDIRFIRPDNSIELPYWRENYTSDTQATFWVKNLYNDSSILLYYGNPTVNTTSNGSATFILFDDFNTDTDGEWYSHNYSQGYYYIRPIGQNLTSARLRWQARCNDVDSRNWAGASFVGLTDINSSSCKTENYTAIRSSYNTDNGASETQPSFKFYTKQDGTGEDNGAYEKKITEGNNYTWDLRFSQSSSKVDVWDSAGTSKYSKTLSNYPPTTVAYQFIQHHDYHGDGGCTEEELTWYSSTPSYLRSYCRGSHYGCDAHVEYRKYWMFIADYASTEPSWSSFSGQQSPGWQIWSNTSNPDTSSPWQWSFDCPDGRGYYEFYSIGKALGAEDESPPTTVDARCHYGNQSKIKNTGSTAFKGYLLMQVQYHNSSTGNWTVVDDTVNESTLRTIPVDGQLGLDTIFNGLVTTNDFSNYGNGTYRIYAAFRDPFGDVLEISGSTKLEATYEFTIQFS